MKIKDIMTENPQVLTENSIVKNAADLMGEPVVRILDPSAFLQVMTSGNAVRDKKVYLAEYGKYVERTIVFG